MAERRAMSLVRIVRMQSSINDRSPTDLTAGFLIAARALAFESSPPFVPALKSKVAGQTDV